MASKCLLGTLVVIVAGQLTVAAPSMVPTDRGAVVETDRYRVEFRDGVIISLVNRLTDEEYLDTGTDLSALLPHLPSGLGTQHEPKELEAAASLFTFPWWEHPVDAYWPNQHFADAASAFTFEAGDGPRAVLTYTGLTDGRRRFDDETYALAIAVLDNGDLEITPGGTSPRPGLYGVNLTFATLGPAITIEAPIWDGMRITREMQPMLWNALWGNYWDYQFAALNGWKRGAVGIWSPDAELRYHKTIYHMVKDDGIHLAFNGMNVPPFDDLTEARPVSWRLQAFEHGWSEAVAHYRDWREAHVEIAPRPDWARQVGFVNMGVNAHSQWLNLLKAYFEERNLDRTVTFGATIREEGFDQNHANNRPYADFKDHMQTWKESGAKMMAYLNPVIMWSPRPTTDHEHDGVRLAGEAKTVMPFRGPDAGPHPHFDCQHLGHPGWQRWFLDWVKSYIQEHDADGVYHDEGQKTPIDNRGPIDGLTPTQGRAQYFYRAMSENPDSIHGTEHLTELNLTGASLGIGAGILWGTAQDMRHQRIRHASPINNALHYPHGVIRGFPHFSDYSGRGHDRLFHWGMDLMERRGEIPGHPLQNQGLYSGRIAPFDQWVNALWLDRTRATTFVWQGLRPAFPIQWDRDVLTYFRGAEGEDYRYVRKPWGTAFVEITGENERLIYGRIHGTVAADVEGVVDGWTVYNAAGPAGLDPKEYYIVRPDGDRPPVHFRTNNDFSRSFYEAYAHDGTAGPTWATVQIKAIPEIGSITRYDNLLIVSETEPAAVWIHGRRQNVRAEGDHWRLNVELSQDAGHADVAVVAIAPEPGTIEELATRHLAARHVSGRGEQRVDIFKSDWVTARVNVQGNRIQVPGGLAVSGSYTIIGLPVAMPAGAGEGHYELEITGARAIDMLRVNGAPVQVAPRADGNRVAWTHTLPLSQQQPFALIEVGAPEPHLTFTWIEKEQ